MSSQEQKIFKIAKICFICLSIPIIAIAFYTHPSVDDYSYGVSVRQYILSNGYNVIGILKCAATFSYKFYFTWTGSYADSFTGALMPENFGCYWISAIILYVFLVMGIAYLFREICKGLAGKEFGWIGVLCALFASVIVTQNIPSPVEGFYWFDGAQSYMGYHIAYIWMCGVVVHYFFNMNKRKSIQNIIVAVVLAFIAAGGNNVTSFISILTYCVFLVVPFICHKKWSVVFPFISSVAGFLINYLAPGTTVRGGASSNYTPIVKTIVLCFRWTLRQYILNWMTLAIGLSLLFLTPFIVKLLKKSVEKNNFKYPYPLVILAGAICFISAMSSPAFYVLGDKGPMRLQNLIYVQFGLVLILVYGYFWGWLVANRLDTYQVTYISEIYQKIPLKYSIVFMVLSLAYICIGAPQKYGMSLEASKEILNGSAKQYHEEILDRYEMYLDPALKNVVVEPLQSKPPLIYFTDYTDDVTNWKNVDTANYFGKETVKLRIRDPEVDY